MTANKLTNLALALTATEAGVASANATPAVDDNTAKIATTAFLFQQMTAAGKQLKATPGYQKFPGGLIIQWGQTAAVAAGSSSLVTFPIPFPNALLSPLATILNSGAQSAAMSAGCNTGNASSMTVFHNGNATAAAISWLAIGH